MKSANLPASLVRKVNILMAKCEAICDADPEMRDVAAMVYIGDIYSLRQDTGGVGPGGHPPRLYPTDFDIDVV